MNWQNYRRLVDYLTTMDPQRFDYLQQSNPDEGCVGCHIQHHFGTGVHVPGSSAIRVFLACTGAEASYLFGSSAARDAAVAAIDPTARAWDDPEIRRHEKGVAEALRRLAVVAARHGGEPTRAYQPDEAAFLASVRELIDQPLVAETE